MPHDCASPSKGPTKTLPTAASAGPRGAPLFPHSLPAVGCVTSFSLSGCPWYFCRTGMWWGRNHQRALTCPEIVSFPGLPSSSPCSLPGRLDKRSRGSKKQIMVLRDRVPMGIRGEDSVFRWWVYFSCNSSEEQFKYWSPGPYFLLSKLQCLVPRLSVVKHK